MEKKSPMQGDGGSIGEGKEGGEHADPLNPVVVQDGKYLELDKGKLQSMVLDTLARLGIEILLTIEGDLSLAFHHWPCACQSLN